MVDKRSEDVLTIVEAILKKELPRVQYETFEAQPGWEIQISDPAGALSIWGFQGNSDVFFFGAIDSGESQIEIASLSKAELHKIESAVASLLGATEPIVVDFAFEGWEESQLQARVGAKLGSHELTQEGLRLTLLRFVHAARLARAALDLHAVRPSLVRM